MPRLDAIQERLRLSLWFVPGIFALAAAGGALLLLAVDRRLAVEGFEFFRFGGTADGARSVLSTVAESMLTFTGLVFTITMLVLQLASSQLSPRVMRTYLRDRKNQAVLGLFVATFLFALLVLREVRSPDEGEGFVPGLSIWVAFVLLVASIGAFVFYIDHMAHAIRASTVIAKIGDEAREAIEQIHPTDPDGEECRTALVGRDQVGEVRSRRAGIITGIDYSGVIELARRAGLTIELVPMIGDFVPHDAPLFWLYEGPPAPQGEPQDEVSGDELADGLRDAVTQGNERTMQQDLAFGMRQLVDIGARALSPGTNDPTTAVAAVDQLHDLLRTLALRPFRGELRCDDDGQPRLIEGKPSWADYVALAFDELRLYGGGHVQVTRRLASALRDIAAIAPEERRAPLLDQLDRLREGIKDDFGDARDRQWANRGSPRGQGPPDDERRR